MKVQMSAEVRGHVNDKPPLLHQKLTAGEAKDFIASCPDEAVLHPIMADRGGQLEPRPILHGLRAIWEEER
jgi:hypothetical protein